MQYFRMLNDLDIPNRWFLGEVEFEDEDEFWNYIKAGVVQEPKKMPTVQIEEEGIPLEFTMGEFELLIVNEKAAKIFDENEVQLIPLGIKHTKSNTKHFLLVIKNELDCIDKEKSEYDVWEEGNEIRPDLAGGYNGFYKMVIDPKLTMDLNIFRIKTFDVAIIVSSIIKNAFESNFIKGVKFKLVS